MISSFLRKRITNRILEIKDDGGESESDASSTSGHTSGYQPRPIPHGHDELQAVPAGIDASEKSGPSNQSPVSPEAQSESEVQGDPGSRRRCQPCQQARASPDYPHRILALLDPLYCAGCRSEQPSIFFSYSSRGNKSNASRLCIGHEGYITVCPHLKFSLADVDSWKTKAFLNNNDKHTFLAEILSLGPGVLHLMGLRSREALSGIGAWSNSATCIRPIQHYFAPIYKSHLSVYLTQTSSSPSLLQERGGSFVARVTRQSCATR
ncbi:hypothetical protein AK830_g3631 [Neonectria ditissima]|uniref:Uncharacterized protein n=1 Tax=Neonectria ditissima TaxID=78410 RepID=A0A0P7BHJ9_9HYPO|nr:hypothetical protein AK830_g3631 [Neonectria ditissima]